MILPLSYYGDPILRQKVAEVTEFDDELAALAAAMVDTMHAEAGIGLAGPQVGKDLRMFVLEIPEDMDLDEFGRPCNPGLSGPLVVVNPEIVPEEDEREEMEEGCLSIPDVRGRVERPRKIRMNYQTLSGESKSLELDGLAARCAQHECDHLNGVLFIDYLGSVKRMAIKGKLKKIRQSAGF